jgi:hypothetical protein
MGEHRRRKRQTEVSRRFQIDDDLKLCRLLNRKIAGIFSVEDSTDVIG